MTRARPLRVAVAAAIGCVLAVLVAESAYRIARVPALSPTTNPAYVEHDDELGWRYKPFARAHHATSEFDVEIRINAQGFRGADWPSGSEREGASTGGTRVLVLGDSFAFGWGVAEDEVFSARLADARPEWTVLNAAVSGYATDQELLLLRRLREPWRPDVVVCVFCSNDLWECGTDRPYGRSKPRFVLAESGLELHGSPVTRSWLEANSALWRAWLKERAAAALGSSPRDRAAEWELVCGLLRRMRDELDGVPLVIVSSESRLAALAREERGIHHVDVSEIGRGAGLAYPYDGHWTSAGHALVAREVERALDALRP